MSPPASFVRSRNRKRRKMFQLISPRRCSSYMKLGPAAPNWLPRKQVGCRRRRRSRVAAHPASLWCPSPSLPAASEGDETPFRPLLVYLPHQSNTLASRLFLQPGCRRCSSLLAAVHENPLKTAQSAIFEASTSTTTCKMKRFWGGVHLYPRLKCLLSCQLDWVCF